MPRTGARVPDWATRTTKARAEAKAAADPYERRMILEVAKWCERLAAHKRAVPAIKHRMNTAPANWTFGTDEGARLRELRELAGLSQAELAEAIGISKKTISHYERGKVAMPLSRANAYAAALHCLPEDLLAPLGSPRHRRRRKPKRALAEHQGLPVWKRTSSTDTRTPYVW